MKLNNEDGIRITSTTIVQAIGNLLNKIDALSSEDLVNSPTQDTIHGAVREIRTSMNNLQNACDMLDHDVDCFCSDILKNA